MKRLTFLFALCLCLMVAVPAMAGVPAKTELGIVGEYVQTDASGANPWTMNVSMLFPIGSGHIVLGPAVAIGSNDDLNRFGAGLDWNLMGQKRGGLFIGADALYFQKPRDEGDQYTVIGRAGVKFNVGKGAALKLAVQQVLDGVGKDQTDLSVSAGIIAKF